MYEEETSILHFLNIVPGKNIGLCRADNDKLRFVEKRWVLADNILNESSGRVYSDGTVYVVTKTNCFYSIDLDGEI